MDLYDRQKKMGLNINQSIIVVGCGGIGFHVAKLLAMSGIKILNLYDNDVIEESNLNRLDLPFNTIGMNKTDVTKKVIKQIRPQCNVKSFPYKLASHVWPSECDWLVDCTDVYLSQVENENLAKLNSTKYLKAGYNGTAISINNNVAQWGDAPDGYTVTSSYIVPALIVAALTVHKILKKKCENKELGYNIEKLYKVM